MLTRRALAALAVAVLTATLPGCRAGSEGSPTATTPSATHASSPAPTAGPDETVLGVLGDFGTARSEAPRVVARMARFAGDRPLAAVITTGDNAYPSGRPAEVVRARAYLNPLLRRGTRLVASLGNHDVATDGGRPAQRGLDMPARWYTTTVGPLEVVVLDSNRTGDGAQLAFLRRVLLTQRTPFRAVVFHHPPAACSHHAGDTNVRRRWLPLLKGRIDLLLAGHNHTYERFLGDGGIPWITTGGGGAPLYPSLLTRCSGGAAPVLVRTVHHALRLRVTPTRLTVEAIGTDGAVFDRVVSAPR